MISLSNVLSVRRVSYGLAIFLFAGLGTLPAHAQNLSVGDTQRGSGTAVITNAGTTASGFYFYDGSAPLATQTDFDSLYVTSSSTTQINGGNIGSISADDGSTVNITGGNILFDVSSSDLYISNSTVNLFGTDFSKMYFFGTSGGSIYFLSGTLADGQTFSTEAYLAHHEVFEGNGQYSYVDDGILNFLPPPAVPESSSAVSLGLLLALGMGGAALRARRGKARGAA